MTTTVLLLRAAHRVRVMLQAVCAFDEHVLQELALLRVLSVADHPLSGRELASQSGISPARVSQIVKTLRQRGLVARGRHWNTRCRAVVVTDAGRAELASGDASVSMIATPVFGRFDERDLATLSGLLRRVNDASAQAAATQ